jgi:hypothetical protein
MHGEVSLMAWEYEVLLDTPEEVALITRVETQRLPFRMERVLRLRQGSGALQIQETVENLSPLPLHCMWGQHPALGEPFVGPDLELHLPPCRISRSQSGGEFPHRVEPGSSGKWPYLPASDGTLVDLRRLPPKHQPASDMVFASELAEGWAAACNPRLGVGFGMSWPLEVWPYLWIWQEFGGTVSAPWFGRAYALGLEPFSSIPDKEIPGLAGAVANGTALLIGANERRSAVYRAVAFPCRDGIIAGISPNGEVVWKDPA